jgi:glycerol-3-phosphate dehydrogenase
MTTQSTQQGTHIYDVAIIGTGIVGCSVAREITLGFSVAKRGVKVIKDNRGRIYRAGGCVILEKSADIVVGASRGNSGILHTGFDATPDTLESSLIRVGYRKFLKLASAPRSNLKCKQTGALMVAWHEEDFKKFPQMLEKAKKNGVNDVVQLTKEELVKREPSLSPKALGALFVPGECVSDTWLPCISYLYQAINNGAKLLTGFEANGGRLVQVNSELSYWEISSPTGRTVRARVVINCAGNYGDIVETKVRHVARHRFKITPRKGQYVVMNKVPEHKGLQLSSIIAPVPTDRTKGILIYPSYYGHLVIGPTAEDQTDREVASVDKEAIHRLLAKGKKTLPSLDLNLIVGTYAGLRPATQFKDYVIEADKNDQWVTVAGIRSTGFTSSLGIAAHVLEMCHERFPFLELPLEVPEEEDIQFQGWPNEVIQNTRENYVTVNGKHRHRVTHPLTIIGGEVVTSTQMRLRPKIAPITSKL